ncbi:MAG: methyltransferase domain-containing protein [Nitrospiraceae bacterium]|nr:methyltransferase domain-containing protein [Nitrospiraceae bacterium]
MAGRLTNIIESFAAFTAMLGRSLERLVQRLRTDGWMSARVCLKCTMANARVRFANRFGTADRVECPYCGWQGHDFLTIDCGSFTVPTAECPHCRGHERHRMLHLYLERRHSGLSSEKGYALHFAPERQVRDMIIRNADLRILSTDYAFDAISRFPRPGIQADMQQLPFTDDSMDWMFCLHVLEHVPDDRRGIAELHRVLRPGGTAFIMVPLMMGWEKTVEFDAPDPNQFDHVRGYSPNDFDERLAPFNYDKVMPLSFLSEDEIQRFRIPHDSQVIYRCTK